MGASFKKFILDDEILMQVKAHHEKIDLSNSENGFAIDIIKEVGKGGEYLTSMHTAMHCRDCFIPELAYRGGLEAWTTGCKPDLKTVIKEKGIKLLECYKQPPLDKKIEQALNNYVKR